MLLFCLIWYLRTAHLTLWKNVHRYFLIFNSIRTMVVVQEHTTCVANALLAVQQLPPPAVLSFVDLN